MQYTNLSAASAALAMAFCCLAASPAQAQSKPAVSTAAVVESSGRLTTSRATEEDSSAEDKRNPMGWAGIGLKLGVAGVGAGTLTVRGREGRTEGRTGLQVSLPINLGGDGFGWVLEPFFGQSSVGRSVKDDAGNVLGDESVSLKGVGFYTGPTITIHPMDPLYIGFGVGLKSAYLFNDKFEYAADVHGRVPVNVTYYLSSKLALVAELGFGYGASVYADKPRVMVDQTTRVGRNVKDDPSYGLAYTWDATIGVRLP